MKRCIVGLTTLAVLVVNGAAMRAVLVQGDAAESTPRTAVTKEEYDRWKTELSNWGRWGKEDTLGAVNLVTREKRKQAASFVKAGITVSLAADADFQKPSTPNGVAPYELIQTSVGPAGAGDRMQISYHGNTVTHMDAFGHRFFDGKMYNGFSWEELTNPSSDKKESIYDVRSGILTRGVLMDIPRLRGVPYLEPGTRIYVEDL